VLSLLAHFNKDFAMKFLSMLGLLGFCMCAVAIRNKGSWDKEDGDDSMSTLLSGFRKYKASLTKDQKVFVKECHQADQALPSYVSCGNTVSCFVKLFSKDPSFTAGKYNLKEEHIEKAMQKVKSDYNKSVIQHHVVDKFALSNRSVYELFSGNSPINRAFVSVERWGGRDFAVDLAYASFQDLVDELLKQDKEEDLPRVFIPYFSWSKVYYEPNLAVGEAQNHIFAIVKRSNINFSVLQGYIKSDVEQGYDLSEWLCSRNPFANINGFGKFGLIKLLSHFDTFLENARPGKKFDGENHAAVFLVREKHFEGSEYLPSFAWYEVEESDIDPSEKIKGMVNKSDEVKFEEQCRDMQKIHQGNLLPGETLQARPGSGSSLSSDKPEEWSIPKPLGHEIYAIDDRTAKEKVEDKAG